ncbi:hypothetical protein [Sphingobium phenoxybenzoativorans]|uniref:hypothetical protein n=1 Tax=Sphingobium phenoxybenzoativorans TaxID=1592790 RepID=UPI0008732F3E|nr:hypothetical protein [Sphingobium phenoxybenzoativorans]
MRISIITAAAVLSLGLAACSEKAADKVEDAGDAIGSDITRGVNNADDHIQSGLHKTGNAIEQTGDQIGDAASNAARKAGHEVDKAQKDVGSTLEQAGKDMKKD